ncbi:hypothetical protein B4129_2197 [Bacillus safensis]|nr:hypothetical protein B4129_2197 [Bacillus safensis]
MAHFTQMRRSGDTSSFLYGFTLFSLNDLPVSISPSGG